MEWRALFRSKDCGNEEMTKIHIIVVVFFVLIKSYFTPGKIFWKFFQDKYFLNKRESVG